MAAVLSYGTPSVQPVVMSSLYSTDNTKHEQRLASSMHQKLANDSNHDGSNHNDEVHSYNLDGISDRSKDNPFTRSKTGSQRSSAPTTDPDIQSLARTPEKPKAEIFRPDDTSLSDVDHISNPRKRRKISPAGDELNLKVEQDGGTVNPNAATLAHNAQFTASTSGSDHRLHEVHKSGSTPQTVTLKPLEVIANTPSKRTSRSKRAANRSVAVEVSEHLSSTESGTVSTPKTKKRTPRKKTLSLHTNGKLLSSPTAGLMLPNNTQNADNTHATSKRNYKMKNGKFVQTLEVVLRYGHDEKNRQEIGRRIDAVLSQSKGPVQSETKQEISKTHPFFLGKVKPKLQSNDPSLTQGETTDNESGSRKPEPVAWKDIKFSNVKPTIFKYSESLAPPWPPLSLQHIGNELPTLYTSKPEDKSNKAKLKSRIVQLKEDENVLNEYFRNIQKEISVSHAVGVPQRRYLSGAEVAAGLQSVLATSSMHDAVSSARSAIIKGSSAFDRGEYAGPNMWTSQYAPLRWSEVLQPSASILHKWLQSLAIHNVKSGIDTNGTLKRLRGPIKKKRRKMKNELDDFIVNSDDEAEAEKGSKTAILITGPHGCGKTASVFTIARELGFEVFEIHSGMRRTAKDIFDKVGDMAHNHLVQKGADLSRSPSVALSGADTDVDTDTDSKQTSIAGLLAPKQSAKLSVIDPSRSNRGKKEQKQSLILFEEVDQLFEDDKGFWTGVQSLIKHSKRPVVLTCNDPSSVPLEDLDLYDILTYEPVEQKLATDYLVHLAAAEGHILDREAVSTLYTMKRHDLRASITELNLWCQMTVGSKQGGLDWMVQNPSGQPKVDRDGNRIRIFSQGTFQRSLDLVPQVTTDGEAAIRFAQDSLGIAASAWCDYAGSGSVLNVDGVDSNLQTLSRLASVTEARSAIDLLDDVAAPVLALATANFNHNSNLASNRDLITSHYAHQIQGVTSQKKALMDALVPIMTEKPIFPPSLGRLAPSIDTCTSTIGTDIAPYVRSIVEFDQHLERQRDEIFGSQGKARKTRAARAAAEGGDKASTRSERWFPKDLDFDKVLQTGSSWPRWYEDEQRAHESEMASPSSLPDAMA